ncbi:MAG: Bug family tripartite tricarboxylate transporter substrate binding protein [Burkholderiales bacterium]
MASTRRIGAAFFGVGLSVMAGLAGAQTYPNRPVRIVTSPAGGGNDFAARLIAQGLSGPLGQQVIVDNRAGGVVPGDVAARSKPDGYTLLVAGGTFTVGPLLEKTPYDPVRDFEPLTLIGVAPNVLVVHPSLPVKSLKELIALARSRPGDLNYSAATPGSQSHLAAELLKSMAKVNIVRVSYKGTGQAVQSVLSGEVQLLFANTPSVGPHVKAGKLRALAVTGLTPSPHFPSLPTMTASGLPGYEVISMDGIYAPAKTPREIVARLNRDIVRVITSPDVKQKFFDAGVEVVGSSPEEFAKRIKVEMDFWGKIIKAGGIKVE